MTVRSEAVKKKSVVTKEEWREYTKTVWSIANVSHKDHPAVFPVEIPHRLIKLFSFWGETVLDPFAGTGSSAVAALRLGRNAICVDQSADYLKIVKQRIKEEAADTEAVAKLKLGDSRDLSEFGDNSVDLIVTSPPYWNKADYGKSKKNLGSVDSYTDFIQQMKLVFEECLRVLKPGRKLCVVTANVNQHTDHGLLTFPLSTDLSTAMRDIGLMMINEIIWSKDGTGGRWGSANGQRPIFGSYPYPPNFLFKNVHEYIIIFSKPSEARTKGAKVKPYRELMRRSQVELPAE
ncbi:DNA modification methylase [Bradyrhizobium elkanii]|uniref:DNA-methyltransferase n=1 Tax=Bradyrhizobium elkanii TaxID=29448 RepID=UPI00216A9CAB|nr:site-specific DNA-methyltransferase [Bradyrhizobium elkanii]MCS3687502.1 site-specific DNA-methyltransferase (adenine-specific) [Bradyrhizobium elkanii]